MRRWTKHWESSSVYESLDWAAGILKCKGCSLIDSRVRTGGRYLWVQGENKRFVGCSEKVIHLRSLRKPANN